MGSREQERMRVNWHCGWGGVGVGGWGVGGWGVRERSEGDKGEKGKKGED